jgi:hypothetical protein
LRFPISIPGALKKKGVQEGAKQVLQDGKQNGNGGSSARFLSFFRKEEKQLLFDTLDTSGLQESSAGDRPVVLETQLSDGGEEMKNKPFVQLSQLEQDQPWLTQEPELDNGSDYVPFLDRITVAYPMEDEYESPIAANEVEATYPFTIYDDFRLRSTYSDESILNYYNDYNDASSGPQFSYPTWSHSDSFDNGMAGARVLLSIQRKESDDPLDFPVKSPTSLEIPQPLLRGSLSSDDLARYDRTAVMENMTSNQQWSKDFDSISHHEHTGGFAMTKSRCRSDPSLGERSIGHTGRMAIVEVHCRSDPSLLGDHRGTAPSNRTPFRASPSFECMLGAKHTITICNNEDMAPRNSNSIDATDNTIVKEEEATTPVRKLMNIGDFAFHPLSKISRSRSDCTSTQASLLETTTDMRRTRSAAMEKANCLSQEGGNILVSSDDEGIRLFHSHPEILASSDFEGMRRFHSQPETVRTSTADDLALPQQEFKDRCSRLVSGVAYDDDQNMVRVFSALLSLDHMCPVDGIDATGSEVDATHFPMQSVASEASASLSRARSFKFTADGSSRENPSPSLSSMQSLKLDGSGRGSALSVSHSESQSLTLDMGGSAKDENHSDVEDLKAHNDGLKVDSSSRDSSCHDNVTDGDVCMDTSIVVNSHLSESCPKTESTSDRLLPSPSSEDFSALTVTHSMSSEDGLYLLTSVDVLEVDTSPTPVASGCLALAANDIGRMARCEMESRLLVSKTNSEYSICSHTVGDETATTGRDSTYGTLTEASSRSFALYGCLHPVSDVLPLYIDFCKSIME